MLSTKAGKGQRVKVIVSGRYCVSVLYFFLNVKYYSPAGNEGRLLLIITSAVNLAESLGIVKFYTFEKTKRCCGSSEYWKRIAKIRNTMSRLGNDPAQTKFKYITYMHPPSAIKLCYYYNVSLLKQTFHLFLLSILCITFVSSESLI